MVDGNVFTLEKKWRGCVRGRWRGGRGEREKKKGKKKKGGGGGGGVDILQMLRVKIWVQVEMPVREF